MLVDAMGRMMEALAPSSVNGLRPDRPVRSDGLAKDVYDQMRTEFFVAGPFVLHDEVPPLLAGAWSLIRETLFTGDADRGTKELIASAVSQANRCPFCVDAHGAAVRAAGAADAGVERWARASASASSIAECPVPPILADHRAELLGTVVGFHYLNRMVSVFLDEKMMPVPDALVGATRPMARVMMGGMIAKAAALEPGRSLPLVADHEPSRAWTPAWAEGSAAVAGAIAGWSATAEREARSRFDGSLLDRLADRIAAWDGGSSDLAGPDVEPFLDGLPAGDRPLGRLAVLTVEAPHRVTDREVEGVVATRSSADALALVAWAAHRAARRCGEWTAAASNT